MYLAATICGTALLWFVGCQYDCDKLTFPPDLPKSVSLGKIHACGRNDALQSLLDRSEIFFFFKLVVTEWSRSGENNQLEIILGVRSWVNLKRRKGVRYWMWDEEENSWAGPHTGHWLMRDLHGFYSMLIPQHALFHPYCNISSP